MLSTFVTLSGATDGYLFNLGDASTPLSEPTWTRRVQSLFRRYSASQTPFSPKDIRSSFITFLKSTEHSDETLRSCAHAMRHSSTMQESAAYDKGSGDRLTASVCKVAAEFASRFSVRVGE